MYKRPLGRFFLEVAMSVDMYLTFPLPAKFISRPLIGPQITWSVQSVSSVNPPFLLWWRRRRRQQFFFPFLFSNIFFGKKNLGQKKIWQTKLCREKNSVNKFCSWFFFVIFFCQRKFQNKNFCYFFYSLFFWPEIVFDQK